jgi:hypothetical protein
MNYVMAIAWTIAIMLVVITVVIHYEALRLLSEHFEQFQLPLRVHLRLVIIMLAIFLTHIAEMLLFAAGMYTASDVFGLGDLGGTAIGTFGDFMYFSVTSYTTLGIGDIVPVGALRVIAGVESLLGLLMITWSASFTFIYMERFWRLGRRPQDDSD